jgi:hypothetical protein
LVKEATAAMKEVVVTHMKATQASADSLTAAAEAGQISIELVQAKTEFGRLHAEYETAKVNCKAIIEEAGGLLETMGRSSDNNEQYV